MIQLRNKTNATSKIGFLASIDTKDTGSWIYTPNNATQFLGVVASPSPYRALTKIVTDGTTKVFIHGVAKKGDTIRCAKRGDNISLGSCVVAKSTDTPYLKVGTALESGKGLISVSLEQVYINTSSTGDFQPLDADLTRLANYRRIGGDTNYTEFEADGTVVFNGDATVWDDLRIVPGSFDRPGASDPSYVLYYPNGGGIGTYLPEFAKNNIASFTVQMPHSYKEGSSIYVHVHWTPGARGNEENGANVGWTLDYTWANINGAFSNMQTLYLTDACDGVDHQHQMTPESEIAGTEKHISSMLLCNIRRFDNGDNDTWTGTISGQLPMLTEIDFHYEIDTTGSRERSTK